jgi:hypothetical protein
METIAQEAKRLLGGIPEDEWMTDEFGNGKNKCCAIGHLMRITSEDPNNYTPSHCSDVFRFGVAGCPLRVASEEFIAMKDLDMFDISDINNTETESYPQPTPKQRVMAFIDDMIAAGL